MDALVTVQVKIADVCDEEDIEGMRQSMKIKRLPSKDRAFRAIVKDMIEAVGIEDFDLDTLKIKKIERVKVGKRN